MVNSPTSREYVTLLDLHISTNGSHETQKIPTTMSFQLVRTPYFSGEKLGVLKQASWKNYQILGGSNSARKCMGNLKGFLLYNNLDVFCFFVFFCIFFADWDPMRFIAIKLTTILGPNMFVAFTFFLLSIEEFAASRSDEKWNVSNWLTIHWPKINLGIKIWKQPPKTNGWNLKIYSLEKGETSTNQTSNFWGSNVS